MLRCRPQPSSSSPARVFVPLETSPLKRSKRIINAANLKRCKSESRIASRSVCAFPVSAAARKSVDRVEGGRNLEGEVIKLGRGDFGTKAQILGDTLWIPVGEAFDSDIQNSKGLEEEQPNPSSQVGAPRLLRAVIRGVSLKLLS